MDEGGTTDRREPARGRAAIFAPVAAPGRARAKAWTRFGRAHGPTEPVTGRLRTVLVAMALFLAVFFGFVTVQVASQFQREAFEASPLVGRVACGDGLTVRLVPRRPRGLRMACMDAEGHEVGGPNNGAFARLALPVALLYAVLFVPLAFVPERVSRDRRR